MNRRSRAFPSSIRTVGRHARWLHRNMRDAFPDRVTAREYAVRAFDMQPRMLASTIRLAAARYEERHHAA